MTLGRKPITIVEIDLPLCANVFGTAPCTAALSSSVAAKCFNTRATCVDTANYDGSDTQTLRFAKNQSGLPKGQTIFPALASVSSRPAELNPSGVDPKSSPLGKRARVTVTFQDFAYSDTLTDPYQAERVSGAALYSAVGYNPASRGTFFGRLIKRQPYYVGKPLRVLQGYEGDSLASMETAHYVISEWKGPDAKGVVTITAKDILDLADNEKAVCPTASSGKLLAAIDGVDTTATLTPTGIGDLEYPASGRVCIGREVITFTRSGDTLTLTGRGRDGTDASAHDALDVVQLCYRVSGATVSVTLRNLLEDYAGVDPAFTPVADWQDEETDWLGGMTLTTTITKPTGVAQLIGEICQLGLSVWWDEIAQEIKMRANRPVAPGETVTPITDAANIISGSGSVDRADDSRISALYFYHGVLDPTDTVTDGKNFAKLVVAASSENLYEQDAFKTIYCRWFGADGDDVSASVIASRLLGRYEATPDVIGATLDVKDRPGVALGSLINVTSYLLQDADGSNLTTQMQISRVEMANDRLMIKAEAYPAVGRFGFMLQDPQTQYDTTASVTDIAEGAFIMDSGIGTFPDGTGPYLIF